MSVIFVCLLLLFHPVYSQVNADPAVIVGKLDNGFSYYIHRHDDQSHKVEFRFIVKAGSFNEDEDQGEMAHLAEHMAFNGTKHYPGTSVVDYFKKASVRYGAFTGDTHTTYTITLDKAAPDVINNCLTVMRDWAQDITLDSVEIDKERGVILAEHTKSESESGRLEMEILSRIIDHPKYPVDPNAKNVASIKSFAHASLIRFYKDWYRPDIEGIIVVGDIDGKEMEKKIRALFSDLKMPVHPRKNISEEDIKRTYAVTLKGANQFFAYQKPFFGNTTVELLLKRKSSLNKLKEDEQLRQAAGNRMFNQMMTARARYLVERYNTPLTMVSWGLSKNALNHNTGLDVFKTRIELGSNKPIDAACKSVLEELQRIKQNGFTPSELLEAKQILMTAGQSSKALTSSQLANNYAAHFITGVANTDDEKKNRLERDYIHSITLAEMNNMARSWIDLTVNRAVVIKAPVEQQNLPNAGMFNEWIRQSKTNKHAGSLSKTENITKLIADTTIFANIKSMYRLVEEDDLGVAKIILSNGATILLKPFKPSGAESDKILLYAYKRGGISLYDHNEKATARNAGSIVQHAGVDRYDKFQLDRYLIPKGVSVTMGMSDSVSSIAGRCNKGETETLLQLLYLRLTKPRKSDDAFLDWSNQRMEERRSNQSNYDKRFFDFVLSNYYLKNVSNTNDEDNYANASSIDQLLAYKIYKERFIDSGGWTFVITGDFNTSAIIPLLAKYIGALPAVPARMDEERSVKKMETAYHFQKGNKNFYLGNNEKAVVYMYFPNIMTHGLATRLKLELLGNVLFNRTWARLREKEGAVYVLNSDVAFLKGNDDVYAFYVRFMCEPGKVDYLKAAVMEEFQQIRNNGIDAETYKIALGKTKGNTLLTDLSRNRFWLDYIGFKSLTNTDMSEVLKRETILNEIINPEEINHAIKKYLNDSNLQTFVWLPERLKPSK
ncbi:MAG TPA: insulinase family protein [Chitinophagaceae bacterium]|nr:insulinase family protein [Chitinophagaceae bacterium]